MSFEGTSAHAEMWRFLRMQSEPGNEESHKCLSQEHANCLPPPAVVDLPPPTNVNAENHEQEEESIIAGQSQHDLPSAPSPVTVHDASWYQDYAAR